MMNDQTGTITDIRHQLGADAKIAARIDEFCAHGWSDTDLFGVGPHGYKGLAYSLRPRYEIGRIWEHACEILCPEIPGRPRARQCFSRRQPLAALLVTVGRHVYPAEMGDGVR